ncbi:hypothetical protein NPS01_08000 [Nocardioides psychrotolerans]|uniref:Chorismate mutase n=1 Tax=Nocardioides psychrotolerans TaxID=1005945 RepID=A0A1I3QTU0_9ACTN|nr:GNAT family N-acetyltransferase [Nocardioides psychrotolerans]GEP37137.1 hypothetical protein NPS01_08000 [Nocardioides psychrotolerans]SFJ36516.1 Chorismate mutase [Nocardioides psychrotolerans]
MPTELVLREATSLDAHDVASVYLRARRAAPMPPAVHPDDDVRRWLAVRLQSDEVWVAEDDRAVVGYARLTEAWLDDLYVDPSRAGQGVGSALLDLAKSVRPDGFCLWVFESNAPARAFYARHGLLALERTDGSANEERTPDIKMAWPGAQPLAFLRGLIDEVDAQLGDLLARRAALTRAVQPLKADPTQRDLTREHQIAAALAVRAPALGAERIERIVHAIITESLDAART